MNYITLIILSILSIYLIDNVSCGELFQNLCKNSTFKYNGIEVNGFHDLSYSYLDSISTDYVDKALKLKSKLESNYLLPELLDPEKLKSKLEDWFLKRENLSFVFGNDPKEYYEKQIFQLKYIKFEYSPKINYNEVAYSIYVPTNDKNYVADDNKCVDGQSLSLFYKNKGNQELPHNNFLILIFVLVNSLFVFAIVGYLLYRVCRSRKSVKN